MSLNHRKNLVNPFRHHIRRHHWWATAFIVAALFIELLVPAGYMPNITDGVFRIQPCASQDAPTVIMAAANASDSAMHGDHKNKSDNSDHAKPEMPCVFSSLSASALGPIDPVLLATAITFILDISFRVEQHLVLWRGLHLRPPSQGPPLPA